MNQVVASQVTVQPATPVAEPAVAEWMNPELEHMQEDAELEMLRQVASPRRMRVHHY